MIKRMVIMLVAVAVVFGGIFGFQVFKAAMIKKFISALSNPPQTISAATAGTSEWQPNIEAIGSLRAVKGAELSLEASGVVESISFNSGDDVAAGAILLKLRTADDVARLDSLKAMAELNEITLDRSQRLLKTQATSQAQLDSDAAKLKDTKAQVAQQQAVIDKKILRAPFAGHLGIRAVDLGQYLGAGTPIVTLQALDPLYVDFYVPQQSVDQGRPGPASVISLLILVLGIRAYYALPVLQYPRTENAVVTVTTVYYGADPDVVAGFITTPLEIAIAQAYGIDYMTSSSQSSTSTITVYLRLNYDADKALTEINTKISSVLNQLPAGTQQPTLTVKVGQPIDAMYIGFNSSVLGSNQITDYLIRVVQPK